MTRETFCDKLIKFLFIYIFLLPLLPILIGPILKIYYFICFSSNRFLFERVSTREKHQIKVEKVQKQVKEWNTAGRKNKMCTGRKAWKTLTQHDLPKDDMTKIQLGLDKIVEIDIENRVVTVEPEMMMGQLTAVLLPKGWTIPVIPEFESLTIGGCICGTGIESSSNKYGLSSDINISYEVVLASGELVNCSKDENSDLFYSIPWSHGTLGFLTAVKIPLIRATKFVKIEYWPCTTINKAKEMLATPAGHDFIEGIMFGPNKFVVMFGRMVDEAEPNKINKISRWYKPWFFKHVESYTKATPGRCYEEYIPLRDYYHRHTKCYFWEFNHPIPFGKRFGPRCLYDKFFTLNHVLQDFMVPMEKLEPMLGFVHQLVEVYPIWLCPCKFFNKPGMTHSINGGYQQLFIDIGIYGITPKKAEFEPKSTIEKLEAFALENHGVQFLYADSYLTREQFRTMFDMRFYDQVRFKYDCLDAFPDVYDKVSKHARRIEL